MQEQLDRSQSLCAARPAIKPMSSGMPIPNSFSRDMTTVRYRATGSLGPAVGTKTGRVRYASARPPKTMAPTSSPHHQEHHEPGEDAW